MRSRIILFYPLEEPGIDKAAHWPQLEPCPHCGRDLGGRTSCPGVAGVDFSGKSRWGCRGTYLILAWGLKVEILIQDIGGVQLFRAGESKLKPQKM